MTLAPNPPTAAFSLIEVVVALFIVELVAVAVLTALLTSFRLERGLLQGRDTDEARLQIVSAAALDTTCQDSTQPYLQKLTLPATTHRPQLDVAVRCGR